MFFNHTSLFSNRLFTSGAIALLNSLLLMEPSAVQSAHNISSSLAQTVASPLTPHQSIALPKGMLYPNGIARSSDGTLYVGSATSGQILRISPQRKIEIFFSGSPETFAVTSLRLDQQRQILWGTSPDFLGTRRPDGTTVRRPNRIFAIDIRTKKVIQSLLMPEDGFGNDIALDEKGGVLITDSWRPRIHYLAIGSRQFQTWAEDEQFLAPKGVIGLAGIARHSSGALAVGMFTEGRLLKVLPRSLGPFQVEPIPLARKIENPDGMQFTEDGSLLVLEGAIASGNGRLLRIRDAFGPAAEPKSVEVVAENLESPVNLTVNGREVWVTESRIRHRLQPGQEKNIPDRFFVRKFVL
jgi:hypothetical protein